MKFTSEDTLTKARHPSNRRERLRLKAKKDRLDYAKDRENHVERRLREEAIEQKEAIDALRKQVLEEEIERART